MYIICSRASVRHNTYTQSHNINRGEMYKNTSVLERPTINNWVTIFYNNIIIVIYIICMCHECGPNFPWLSHAIAKAKFIIHPYSEIVQLLHVYHQVSWMCMCGKCCYCKSIFYIYTVEPQKTDSPYFRNLHNADKWLRSWIIPHSLLYLATPNYALKSRSNGQNQYKFPSENG